ncbi:MAG: hypothetical protein ABI852_12175 [Gemmatimonadaceae bacterium]
MKFKRFALLAVLFFIAISSATTARAQSVVIDGPSGPVLPNLTPLFTVRALGFPLSERPLQFLVFLTFNSTGDGPFIETITATGTDTIQSLFPTRLLPSQRTVYWKARVIGPNGVPFESAISSARQTPKWLTLISPMSAQDTTRRPLFKWESGAIDPLWGRWSYTIEILDSGVKLSEAGLTEMTYRPKSDLEANQRYHWQLTAIAIPSGQSVLEKSVGTFGIDDPALPTTSLLYQNFPNPFPSLNSFETCFWFDVQTGGSRVSLDILDLRGTLVKTILPPTQLAAGVYGRGPVGAASNCDNRYVWNGTASDGRSVPGGIYLARFTATGLRATFKKIVFKGR